MAEILNGAPVAQALSEVTRRDVEELKSHGIDPTLAILRVGANEADLSYERGAMKRCEKMGVSVKSVVLPENVDSDTFFDTIEMLNHDDTVHGILLFRPLPRHLDDKKARNAIAPKKDIDGCTDISLAGVFTGAQIGFPPCTAQACIEILDHYGISCEGKRAVVLGRSLVIGRPVAMLLMAKNATVTICHSKTPNASLLAQDADILISATGIMESVGKEYFAPGQTVIDVGINWNSEKNKLCGDVRFEEAESIVGTVTPVPGGVGSVTTSVLVRNVVLAAMRKTDI